MLTYCDDDFTIQTYIESLCCTPKAKTMLFVNYVSKKKKKDKRFEEQK